MRCQASQQQQGQGQNQGPIGNGTLANLYEIESELETTSNYFKPKPGKTYIIKLDPATNTTTRTVIVGDTIRFIYLIEDPNVKYISCAFCTGNNPYRGIDPSFMVVHMLECHKSELLNAPVVSHGGISPYYSLEARAILITELVRQSNYMPAGWLAVRIRKKKD